MRSRTRYALGLIAAAVAGGAIAIGVGAASGDSTPTDPRDLAGVQAAAPQQDLAQATPTPPTGPGPGPQGEATELPPPIRVSVDGHTFTVAAVVPRLIDLGNAQLVAQVNGRSYLTAPSADNGDPCFIEVPDSQATDAVIGCDPADQLEAKGGWLIYHGGSVAGTKSGVLILSDRIQATAAAAADRPLEVDGRAIVFENIPQGTARVDVTTAAGERHIPFT